MATEDDNFDIDIYGDGNEQGDYKQDDADLVLDVPESAPPSHDTSAQQQQPQQPQQQSQQSQDPATNGDHAMPQSNTSDSTPAPHGVKRKDYEDRPSDPDATTALMISDLFWWTTDDDIRGWVNAAAAEGELKDVTFSEHKVNGKSKGQAYVEFTTTQASTASKHIIESGDAAGGRKHAVNYTNPHTNPFRTLPKDAPMRKDANRNTPGGFNAGGNQNFPMNMGGGGYRGRGGYNNRGMGNMNFNNRNNFNPMGGFQGGGPAGGMMPGFQGGPMGGMQNYGFNNRGGMMGGGMRGGPGGMRGGRGGNMMGMPNMNPMGNMGMPMAGGMNPMMGGMAGNMGMQGQGFQGPNPAFNQGFFNNQGGGDASWNPHGAKRSRQE
ncbi:RRM domain protein [Penicillium capsulatum]|uniref:RRM domain protein n=1 Tax=Penicillium capsulatum TaxID=69766 RepID=A0A9W9I052_9EURO|nr:RRM domain protein [Penicillium capsulatum]KAJ6117413.1 RRM domain protein [Penicillium capsulatum]